MNNLADGIECHLVKKTSRIMNGMAGKKRPCELARKGQGSNLTA